MSVHTRTVSRFKSAIYLEEWNTVATIAAIDFSLRSNDAHDPLLKSLTSNSRFQGATM